jgi:anti-sigma factor (TIGR02949 family)
MNCAEVKNLLSAFVDGEVADGRLRDSIQAHLAECESCMKEYELQLRVKTEISRLGIKEAASTLSTRIMAEIGQRRRRRAAWRWSYASAGAVALVVVVILLVGGLWNPYSSTDIYKNLPDRAPARGVISEGAVESADADFEDFILSRHEEARDMLKVREEWAPELNLIVQRLSGEEGDDSLYKELPAENAEEEDEPSADEE